MTPFRRGYLITQKFGQNPANYKPLGFDGHDGIDLVPTDENGKVLALEVGKDNWDILAIEDGVVVRDFDDPKAGGYGIYAVVYNPKTKRAWWYGHFAANYVAIGTEIKRGDRLGQMGSTGNSTGAHLHLGLRLADANGNAVNTDNGYKGFVDPLEALESFNKNSPFPPVNVVPPKPIEIIDWEKKFKDLEKTFENYRKEAEKLLNAKIEESVKPYLDKINKAIKDLS
jgi:murein DD-endopeptidase MepM/ murein hydrolase activator NlpD